jgi:hypothetical protein
VLVDGSWHTLPHGTVERGSFQAHPVGDAIAVDEYTFVDPTRRDPIEDPQRSGASGVFVYHQGRATPFHIPPARCATPEYTETPGEITCFGCGDAAPFGPVGRGCGVLHIETFDVFGRSVAARAVVSPAKEPVVEGRLLTGQWIVAERALSPDFLFFGAPLLRFRLDPCGFTALPFGADPLHVEIDAEERAAELLREVPIRDAAVAALRAAFAEDERAHPTWVVRKEVLNRVRAHQAMEPDVRAEPGTCFTVVARGSEGLTRIELSLHRKTPFAPEWPPSAEGLLGMAADASPATLSRCVAPGDPEVLHLRVGAGAGAGYMLARIYAHSPP